MAGDFQFPLVEENLQQLWWNENSMHSGDSKFKSQLQDHWLHGLRQGFFQWVILLRYSLMVWPEPHCWHSFALILFSTLFFLRVRSEVSAWSLLLLPSLSFPVISSNKSLVYI